MSSAKYSCKHFNPIFAQANSVDLDQSAPRSSLIWVRTVWKSDFFKSQADHKADDHCYDWQLKG